MSKKVDQNNPFTIERTYDAPVSKVWKAITDKDDMKKWYFELKEFKPRVGFEFSFMGGEPNGVQYKHLCRVTEVIHMKKLSYSWQYEGYDGYSEVTFELIDLGDKTKVILTHKGLESFPKEPALARKNFETGWNEIIGQGLKEFVEA